ncbi:MAG: bifunctional adenosylcobinamide kinase/adenosylcobinamide-phosphate guanylyltransferase [Deltaproteobacteria bacterium GWA2_54_12]|nr:MAG: bifunctional adenosylcobinamide kinase/adenosylcobinamide-phosphate guanylyltransferase [Deltaproteobacteria bacterium GWA2_54_12]
MDRGLVFIVGGARSGKSAYALGRASNCKGRKVYIATAQALDSEMSARIDAHRIERGEGWETIEESLHVAAAIAGLGAGSVVVIDCLTLWLSNLLHSGMDDEKIKEAVDALAAACALSLSPVIAVSNEVGLGLVPENPLARRFRDLSGWMNQKMAAKASEAWLVASGIPLKLK